MVEYSQKWHNGTSRSRSTETSDRLAIIQAQINNLGREIKKVNEKVYPAQVGCEQCKGPHYNKDCPLKEEWKTLEEAYYTQFDGSFQGGGYRAASSGFYKGTTRNPIPRMKAIYERYLDQRESIKSLEIQIGKNEQGALINVPIFVGIFSVVTDFAVLENMDAYRDEGMGNVIFGEPFLREVGIKARRFEEMITIYNGNKSVTYRMVRSHLRFKHHTNEQCNKIPSLLKVSDKDKKNGISHPYPKTSIRGSTKGVYEH
ncbi:hypothetical protein Tco_1134752 [Tanacetum coccineum]